MSDSGVRVVNEGGIDAYLAAADDPLVAALREYHSYFHDGLWQKKQPSPLPIVLYMNAYQLFLAAARMALSGHLTFPPSVRPTQRVSVSVGVIVGCGWRQGEAWREPKATSRPLPVVLMQRQPASGTQGHCADVPGCNDGAIGR